MLLVTGATGNVGRELVDALVQRGDAVRALTRDPASADLPDGVEVVQGSTADRASMERAMRDVDGVFLNLVGDVTPTVDAVRSAGIRRVVLLSSVCALTRHDLVKAERFRTTEDELRSVHDDLVALRPGQFMSNTLWWRPMLQAGHVTVPFPDVTLPAIDPADIAAVAVATLHDDRFAGTSPVLTGGESTTPRERVAILAEVLDRPLECHEQSEAQFRATQAHQADDDLHYLVAMTGSPNEADREMTSVVAEVTGRPPRTFREWATQHRDALR